MMIGLQSTDETHNLTSGEVSALTPPYNLAPTKMLHMHRLLVLEMWIFQTKCKIMYVVKGINLHQQRGKKEEKNLSAVNNKN